jgi:hypothetical protein
MLLACLVSVALGSTISFAQRKRDPQVLAYNSSNLARYSDIELMDFLSGPSIEKNVHGQGMFSMLPPDRNAKPAPTGFGSTHVFTIKIDDHALDSVEAIEDELIRRHPVAGIVHIFDITSDRIQQAWMLDILARLRGDKTDAALRPFVTEGLDDANYLALKYFAEKCDAPALTMLNRNYFKYGASSMEWASIVREFGKCRYKPASENLVRSIGAMNIDLGYAALQSLEMMYPDAHIAHDSNVAQAWQSYLVSHP